VQIRSAECIVRELAEEESRIGRKRIQAEEDMLIALS
jgi:hypothetical protein